jgi:hypothetical protein
VFPQVENLLDLLLVVLPGLPGVRKPLHRPFVALEDSAIPNVVELELRTEALARQRLERVDVPTLQRLVAPAQELDVLLGHRPPSMQRVADFVPYRGGYLPLDVRYGASGT